MLDYFGGSRPSTPFYQILNDHGKKFIETDFRVDIRVVSILFNESRRLTANYFWCLLTPFFFFCYFKTSI